MKEFKSGYVSIIGRPNVGKSTLLNNLIGQKIAIMSNKPQTTRTKITGILNTQNMQAIFIDTPGIHKPKHKLGKIMNEVVDETITEVDVHIFIVEADSQDIGKGDQFIIEKLKDSNIPCILVINKIDKIKREKLLSIIENYMKLHKFDAVVPISALKDDGVDKLINEIEKILPVGPKYYENDELTNQTERQIIEEIVREKTLHFLNEEIPHGIVTEQESFKVKKKNDGEKYYDIGVTIYCEKESHKGIIIGSKGTMLKRISTSARIDIEKLLDAKVNLKTWVKVKDDWRDNDKLLNKFFKN